MRKMEERTQVTKGIWSGKDLKNNKIVRFEFFFKFKVAFKEFYEVVTKLIRYREVHLEQFEMLKPIDGF